MEIITIIILSLILITLLLNLLVITRGLTLIRDDMQLMIKSKIIEAGDNRRAADNIERIAKLSP